MLEAVCLIHVRHKRRLASRSCAMPHGLLRVFSGALMARPFSQESRLSLHTVLRALTLAPGLMPRISRNNRILVLLATHLSGKHGGGDWMTSFDTRILSS